MSRSVWNNVSTAQMLSPLWGYAIYQIAGVTSRLGVPDVLEDGPKTAGELAEAIGADPDYLLRLLRAAAAAGLLSREGADRFGLTEVGRMYLTSSPLQAAPLDAMYASLPMWQAWGALEEAVRTGTPAFNLVHGTGLFEYLKTAPELAPIFHAAQAAGSVVQLPAIVEHYDFSGLEHVVDVGGGNGTHLAAILAANPSLRGTVFDAPNGLAEAPNVLAAAGVADRCDTVGGSFFESVPAGADAYLLKNILHDWHDDQCVEILTSCRNAMAPNGKVVVFTSLAPEGGPDEDPDDALGVSIFDIDMMVLCTGRERTLTEFDALFARAGFKRSAVTPLPCPFMYYAIDAIRD